MPKFRMPKYLRLADPVKSAAGGVAVTFVENDAVTVGFVSDLFVTEHMRNKGIGGELIQLAVDTIKETLGSDAATVLFCYDDLVDFYLRRGFEKIAYSHSLKISIMVQSKNGLTLKTLKPFLHKFNKDMAFN